MSLFNELMKRVMGRPRDIKLPNETGQIDPRLPKNVSNTIDATKGAIKRVLGK